MALKLATMPQMKGQFYLFGQKEVSSYEKATAAQRLYSSMKMPPEYDRKATYRIFFTREDRPDQFDISGTEGEFGRAFIPRGMESKFPHNHNCHPMKPFDIAASYHCMTFTFHIAGNVAITRNYWRSQNPEIEVAKNLGKLMVVKGLEKDGVRFIVPRVNDGIQDYSVKNLANYLVYPIGQVASFFISDPHGKRLGAPILENPLR